MQRRKFIKSGLSATAYFLSSSPIHTFCAEPQSEFHSRVVIARDPLLQPNHNQVDADRLISLLDSAMQTYFEEDDPIKTWKNIVQPGEVIGLKVNTLSGPGGTHRELVEAICERLLKTGIKPDQIIIWDRLSEDLENGGYKIVYRGNQIKCFGNDAVGFTSDFEMFGSAASLISKTINQLCDGVINVPVLKDHGIAGLTMSLKNMFGAIHNPNKYHLNVGDPYIADVYNLPSIKNKIRFTICDTINPQYEGGPSYMPQWAWPFNGLLIGSDPVALDHTGWHLVEEQRMKHKLKSLKESGREPTYLSTAADSKHRLGTNDPEKMKVIEI